MGSGLELLLTLAALPVGLFAIVHFAILKSFPEYVRTKSVRDRDLPFQVMDRVYELEELGFERFGTALSVDLFISPLVVPLYHAGTATFATSFCLETKTARRGIELITMLEPNGALTSGVDRGKGTLPPWRGSFRQILPGASAAELMAMHVDALEFLAGHGIRQRYLPFTVEDLLQEPLRSQRMAFLAHGFKNTLVAILRSVTRKNPYLRPLDLQLDIRQQIAAAPRQRAYAPQSASRAP